MIKTGDLVHFKFDTNSMGAYHACPNSLALVWRTFSPQPRMYLANVWWVTGIPAQNGDARYSTVNLEAVKKYDPDR
jgi:hypothetical protein